MRTKLAVKNNIRANFTGIFERFGTKNGWKGRELKTVLLAQIKDENGELVADHLWFNYTEGFRFLGELKEGDKISFTARVKAYERGYFGYRKDVYKPYSIDYKLSHPTNIINISDV